MPGSGSRILGGTLLQAQTNRPRVLLRSFASPFALAVAASCLMPAPALAQAGPAAGITPPNRTDLVPPDQRPPARTTTLTVDGDFERPPCALDRPEYAGIKFTVKGAAFDGLARVPGLSLEAAYGDYVGRELPVSILCDIRAEANAILRRDGYLATVEIPEQSLADGVPDFKVVFGRLASVRVRGEAGASEALVASYLEKLTDQDVFNINDAERYLLLADDLPGLDVRLSLRPAAGGAPGDLVGEVAVLRQRAMIDLNVQNLASRAIGRYGGVLRAEIYDVTGLGDRTSVAVFSTLDFEEQQTVQIGHDFRVGSEGLRLGGQFTWSSTNPATAIPGFSVESETIFGSVFASYPLLRTRANSLYADAGFEVADQDVDLNGFALTRDRVRMAYVRLSGEMTDKGSIQRVGGYSPYEPKLRLRYGAELRQGLDVLSASPDCRPNLLACLAGGAAGPSRIEADPTPLLLRLNTSAEYRPVPLWTLALSTQAQMTGDPLPSFEELAAGSFSIGRGYDPGAVLGDSGILGSFELRYGSLSPETEDGVAWQPFVFTDVAFVWNEDPSRRATNPDRLWSAGGGLRLSWGRGIQSDMSVAVPLETPDLAQRKGDVRFLFSITARLFPWRF